MLSAYIAMEHHLPFLLFTLSNIIGVIIVVFYIIIAFISVLFILALYLRGYWFALEIVFYTNITFKGGLGLGFLVLF